MGSSESFKKSRQGRRNAGKVESHLTQELQQVKWEEFKLGDLFESSNGDFDIKKEHINDTGDYVITAGLGNNGILGRSDIDSKIFDGNTITVDMFGNAFYRQFQYKMVTHARVFSLKPLFKMNQKQGLFIANSLHFLKYGFGYDNMCSWVKIKNTKISLPTQNGTIDFDFMENFIAQLEAYLLVTGLKDYKLNLEEEKALNDLKNMQWGGARLIDLFEVKNTKNILSRNIIENSGNTPYLTASRENNAISSYISYDENYLEKGNCIFIGGKTFVVTYQSQDFYSNDSHNLLLRLKDEGQRDKFNQLFLATCIYRGLSHKYSWGDSISSGKIQSDIIRIPIKNAKPDYDYMQLLISAIQKLIIKEVVLYADRKIEATRAIIQRSDKAKALV